MRWRRLDLPGTDECELVRHRSGWRLEGLARFETTSGAARLRYRVEVGEDWCTHRGEVDGVIGPRAVRIVVERSPSGDWRVEGRAAPGLVGLADLDLGFTPATNLFPLRRLGLRPGMAADTEAAWLDDASWTFARLPQRYERRDALSYWYQAPTTGYAALLRVTPEGFVSEYPGLWVAED